VEVVSLIIVIIIELFSHFKEKKNQSQKSKSVSKVSSACHPRNSMPPQLMSLTSLLFFIQKDFLTLLR